MAQPDRSTFVNVHRRKECPEHGERVQVPIGKGYKRCPIDGCIYTRR